MENVTGNARVYDKAHVYDRAKISDNARVYGHAVVSGNADIGGNAVIESTADYLTLGPARSSGRFTTAHRDSEIGIRVNCGCFSGTVLEFSQAVEEQHKNDPEALKQYRLFCQLIAFNFNVKEETK